MQEINLFSITLVFLKDLDVWEEKLWILEFKGKIVKLNCFKVLIISTWLNIVYILWQLLSSQDNFKFCMDKQNLVSEFLPMNRQNMNKENNLASSWRQTNDKFKQLRHYCP